MYIRGAVTQVQLQDIANELRKEFIELHRLEEDAAVALQTDSEELAKWMVRMEAHRKNQRDFLKKVEQMCTDQKIGWETGVRMCDHIIDRVSTI